MSAAIRVENLEKRFGDVEAVSGVDRVPGAERRGQVDHHQHAVHPLEAHRGRAEVAGFDVVTRRNDVRREIGLVLQDTTLDTYLTAAQNLRFHGQLYGVPSDRLDARMRQVLELVGLWGRREKPTCRRSRAA